MIELLATQADEATPTGVHATGENEIIFVHPTGEQTGEQNTAGLDPGGDFFDETGAQCVMLRQDEQAVTGEIGG